MFVAGDVRHGSVKCVASAVDEADRGSGARDAAVFSPSPGSFSVMKQVMPLWAGSASGSVFASRKMLP